ncbi:MAG: GNAT family N-acetyltransferase [Syntrophales bacterium]
MNVRSDCMSARIHLRELTHADVTDRYLSWFRDAEVTRFLEAHDLTYQEVIEYMDQGRKTGTYFLYAICVNENSLHIGNLKIGPLSQRHGVSDMVTVIGDKAYWGQGIATEAITLGVKIAFGRYHVRKLSASMYSDNIGSLKAYLNAGWFEEARLKAHGIVEGKLVDGVYVACFNPNVDQRRQ